MNPQMFLVCYSGTEHGLNFKPYLRTDGLTVGFLTENEFYRDGELLTRFYIMHTVRLVVGYP